MCTINFLGRKNMVLDGDKVWNSTASSRPTSRTIKLRMRQKYYTKVDLSLFQIPGSTLDLFMLKTWKWTHIKNYRTFVIYVLVWKLLDVMNKYIEAQFVSKVNLAFFSYFLFILSFEILHFRPIERIFCLLTTFCVGKNWISEVFLLKNELHNQTWYLKRTLVVVVLLSVISIHHTSQSSTYTTLNQNSKTIF